MAEESFTRYFLAGVFFRMAQAAVAMACAVGGAGLGSLIDWPWARFVGGCVGLFAGVMIARRAKRRWDPLNDDPASAA